VLTEPFVFNLFCGGTWWCSVQGYHLFMQSLQNVPYVNGLSVPADWRCQVLLAWWLFALHMFSPHHGFVFYTAANPVMQSSGHDCLWLNPDGCYLSCSAAVPPWDRVGTSF